MLNGLSFSFFDFASKSKNSSAKSFPLLWRAYILDVNIFSKSSRDMSSGKFISNSPGVYDPPNLSFPKTNFLGSSVLFWFVIFYHPINCITKLFFVYNIIL